MDPKNQEPKTNFAPVVSVLGHVDHGKTSLLDKIRETQVATREKGGITQKIGASKIEIDHEGVKRKITFIDTPGHEAFANMRSQGVNSADVVLLIVAADDGVMPQTRESIGKILAAKIPFIVVFTKIDMEGAIIEKAKQSVIKEGVLLEGLGGDVPFIGVSSKTGENIKELLDLIVLVYDMSGIKKDGKDFMGVVIDAKADRRRGVVATVVVKSGKLSVSSLLFAHGVQIGKVKSLIDSSAQNVKEALPGDAVEILGVTEILPAGSVIFDREVEPEAVATAKPVVQTTAQIMEFLSEKKPDFVPIIIKTESAAELEALRDNLPDKVRLIYQGEGEIGLSDILMANDFHALVLGFNVGIDKEAKALAESEKVFFKSYEIIYQLLDELTSLIQAINTGEAEKQLGKGEILSSFLGSSGVIIGLKVTAGRLAVGDRIRIKRGEKELGASKIISIRHGKEDIRLANINTECGVMIDPEIVDFQPQDAIIAYSKGQ